MKEALNNGLSFKKVHRITKFNQKTSFKPYIVINTELRTETENNYEKDFSKRQSKNKKKLFGKIMENVWKRRDIRLVIKDIIRRCLVSEQHNKMVKNVY